MAITFKNVTGKAKKSSVDAYTYKEGNKCCSHSRRRSS